MPKGVKVLEPKSLVHLYIKWELLDKIEKVQEKKKMSYRVDAITYLLDLAIKFLEKVESVPEEKLNNELEEINSQLKEGGLVDYVARMNGRDLKNLYKIISEEYQFRTAK